MKREIIPEAIVVAQVRDDKPMCEVRQRLREDERGHVLWRQPITAKTKTITELQVRSFNEQYPKKYRVAATLGRNSECGRKGLCLQRLWPTGKCQ